MKNRQAEIVRHLTSEELMFHLLITQLILLIIAVIASLFLFDHIASFLKLFHYDPKWILIGALSGVIVVIIDIVLMKWLPNHFYDDGGINEKLFAKMPLWQVPIVALFVAVSEELLFRGIIQTKFGIIFASIIFALIHTRYWSHWYLMVNVVVLSFWIGMIYKLAGAQLLPVIMMHFTIDCLLGFYLKYDFSQKECKEGE